jgi:phage tail protein X
MKISHNILTLINNLFLQMNRYQNIPQTKLDTRQAYVTSRYPEVPVSADDIYVYTTQGDRFDVLAQQYYNDSSLWWVISIANTATAGTSLPSDLPQNSLMVPEGLQIRIPNNPQNVVSAFKLINQ